mmetsp:Transcript_42682/g.107109  ORF Transcript_42682/g.107109 Transcript_42682/m.107109 type:complete len:201 (-) Transcript_42682:24-626(-)
MPRLRPGMISPLTFPRVSLKPLAMEEPPPPLTKGSKVLIFFPVSVSYVCAVKVTLMVSPSNVVSPRPTATSQYSMPPAWTNFISRAWTDAGLAHPDTATLAPATAANSPRLEKSPLTAVCWLSTEEYALRRVPCPLGRIPCALAGRGHLDGPAASAPPATRGHRLREIAAIATLSYVGPTSREGDTTACDLASASTAGQK